MSEYTEKRVVVQAVPVGRSPVIETRVDSVVDEGRGMSGVAVAALVLAAITAAVVITMLILNGQQKTSDDLLAQERARTAAAQQAPAQPAPQQQPLIVTVPASQPAAAAALSPVVTPVQPPPSYTESAPSNAALEIDVTSILQSDPKLRTYAIDVKVTDGTAVLSGNVSDEALMKRAGRLAETVHGIKIVINDIEVKP